MESKKEKKVIKNLTVKRTIGIFICLFTVFVALNQVNMPDYIIYLARAINWVVAFFFGGLFSYAVYLFVFLYGLFLILNKNVKNIKKGLLIAGTILFCLGAIILITNSINLDKSSDTITYLTFDNFGTKFIDNVIKTDDKFRIDMVNNTGLIGMVLVASINSLMNYVASFTIGSILFVAGFIMLVIKPILFGVKKFNEYKNFNIDNNPKGKYTKSRDITVTTTTLNTINDTDIDDVETERVQNEGFQDVSREEVIAKLEREKEEKIAENLSGNTVSSYKGEHFSDTSLIKAKFDYEDNSDQTYTEKNTNVNKVKTMSQDDDEEILANQTREFNYENLSAEPRFVDLENIQKNENKSIKQPKKKVRYVAPSISLLENRTSHESEARNKEVADERSAAINQILSDLGVKARVISYKIGPSVTRYDIQTDRNESIRGFEGYLNDICIRLGGISARFSPIVLGKTTSGLEIPNAECATVNFKDCIQALNRLPKAKSTNIPFGKDINNELLTVDLQETPHLLVSGTTGSGKSIFVHSIIMSLIMRNSPENLKLVLIDPKTVEFTKYREIPHLMCPPFGCDVPDRPYEVLQKICDIMEERYALFSQTDCTKLKTYNDWAIAHGKETLPIIVVVIDEYADLVDTNKKISEPVVRIGQKARAAGIHMIIATQRPSVNVINGVIKANVPSRVALKTASQTDSLTVIDQGGAEKLIGNGDMLVKCAVLSNTFSIRCQGAYISDEEIKAVCDYLRGNYGPNYDEGLMDIINKPVQQDSTLLEASKESRFGSEEEIYEEVKKWTMSEEYISMSKIQTTFGVGFNRASRMFKRLQAEGVISSDPANNSAKGSKVLIHNMDVNKFQNKEFAGSVEQTTFKKN